MSEIKDLRAFLVEWNNTFIFDREYRKSNQISFNSLAHRNTCQIDIFLEYMENQIYKEHQEMFLSDLKKEDLYSKGEWISEKEIKEEELNDAFDRIVI